MSPEKAEDRPTINRSYDIYVDQNEWLINSPLNKSKTIRGLLDKFINEVDATVIQNLRNKVKKLENEIQSQKEVFDSSILGYEDQFRKLLEEIEQHKAVIVAMGGE